MAEVALITVSCVLFVQMGLSGAVQDALHIDLRIASCPKCLTYWVCLVYLLIHDYGIVVSVATSFIFSYAALWLALMYDALAVLYNRLYEKLPETDDASPVAEADAPGSAETDADEMS